MAISHVTVGSGDHHVLAVHGWFGSARGWGSRHPLRSTWGGDDSGGALHPA
jgi:hypothetical protein